MTSKKQIEAKNIDETEAKAEMMTPTNTVQTDSGSTHVQEKWTFEVVNEAALIKAALDGRTRVPMGIIKIDEGALRQQIYAQIYQPKKWAKFGVKVERVKQVVTRSA